MSTWAAHQAEWAWVVDAHEGLIARIVAIEDLSGVAEPLREVISRAQSARKRAA
jgi:hypothetical protein